MNVIKKHKDIKARIIAVNTLSSRNRKTSETLRTLEDIILNEENRELISSAIHALQRFDKNKSNQILLGVIKNHNNPDIRRNAIYYIHSDSKISSELTQTLENII